MRFTLVLGIASVTIAGCSGNSVNPPPPGWVSTIQPGEFVGIWTQGAIVDSCKSSVTEAGTILSATAVNGSTNEVLTLMGRPAPNTISYAERPYIHVFAVYDSSNFHGDTDSAPNFLDDVNCVFSSNTDTLFYTTLRGIDTLTIVCIRTSK